MPYKLYHIEIILIIIIYLFGGYDSVGVFSEKTQEHKWSDIKLFNSYKFFYNRVATEVATDLQCSLKTGGLINWQFAR